MLLSWTLVGFVLGSRCGYGRGSSRLRVAIARTAGSVAIVISHAIAEGRAQDIGSEEVLAVDRHHHDLELVGKPLGDNFLDQHGVLLEHGGFKLHALGISSSGYADAVSFRLRKIVLAFEFSFAVYDFGLRGCFGVLQSCFLARFSFQFTLLNLLLLEWKGVLHRIRFGFGLQDTDLRLRLSVLYVAGFLRVRLQFSNFYLFQLY